MSTKKRPENWPPQQKLQMVQQYDTLGNEEARGRLLREHGLYRVDRERWRKEMLQALKKKPSKNDPNDRRIKDLEG